MFGAHFLQDGLVDVRVEIGPERLDRPDAVLAEQVVELRVDELDALPVAGRTLAALDRQRTIEVVDDEQDFAQQISTV